ncbi:MAG: DUF554 domain-containing protein [Deltaproteobacteria bacterium]|jgi:uncharacterized membrane protein YqgA involved in biofilm formation|nr:DUF554 domain-containing protein [Deltaproteobacteria bacterium]
MILPWGAIVNALAIIAGSLAGMLCGARLPERVRQIVFQGLGLCLIVLGVQMGFRTQNQMVVIFSTLIGGVIGALLRFEDRFLRSGERLKLALRSKNPQFTEGMVNGAVLFCIGAMAILGSFDEGLRGDRNIVYTKSILDMFAAIAMASVFGGGVLFSAFFVLAYQGALTLFAGSLQMWITPAVMTEMTAVGGVLILGIGLNLLELTRIPLSNMLPALFLVLPIFVLCA